MHACLNKDLLQSRRWPQCSVAGYGTNIPLVFTTGASENGRVTYVSLRLAETFIRGCLRPTEAACFCVKKCSNNRQLIVVAIHRFVRYAYAYAMYAALSVYQKCKQNDVCATYTIIHVHKQTVILVFFVHGNSNTHACLTRGWNLFYFDERPI